MATFAHPYKLVILRLTTSLINCEVLNSNMTLLASLVALSYVSNQRSSIAHFCVQLPLLHYVPARSFTPENKVKLNKNCKTLKQAYCTMQLHFRTTHPHNR